MALDTFKTRALVAFIFGPLILLSIWFGNLFFLAIIAIIVVLGMKEFYAIADHKEAHPQKVLGIVLGAVVLGLFFLGEINFLGVFFIYSFLLITTIELFRNQPNSVLNIGATFMGVFYVAVPIGSLVLIRETLWVQASYLASGKLIIFFFLSIWFCDSMAYIGGSKIGKHKLFPRVSPNKTVEGTLTGFLTAILTAYLCHLTFLDEFNLVDLLVIGALCGSFGQLSDLVESLFKRDAGIKDSSNLIPGHGGILDRFDSEILAAPAVFLYLKIFVI